MVIKRIVAYIFDILIVVFAASMLASISYLNPKLSEYNKVYDEYLEFYEDYKISINDIKDTETIVKYKNELDDFNYRLDKSNVYGAVISIILTLVYFAVFQKYNGGQTLGKKIMKLKISPNLNLSKYFLRTIILHSTWANILKLLLIITVSKKHYILANNILSILSFIIETTIIIMVAMRSDNKGLHDLIINSNVVPVLKEKKEEK